VIDAMGEQLTALINVTIHYPDGNPSFWDLLCGRIGQVVMRIGIRSRSLPSFCTAATTRTSLPAELPGVGQ
jgi:hypothetical protein